MICHTGIDLFHQGLQAAAPLTPITPTNARSTCDRARLPFLPLGSSSNARANRHGALNEVSPSNSQFNLVLLHETGPHAGVVAAPVGRKIRNERPIMDHGEAQSVAAKGSVSGLKTPG